MLGAAFLNDPVFRRGHPPRLEVLLKGRLVINGEEFARAPCEVPWDDDALDKLARRLDSSVAVKGRHDRLQGVDQQGGLASAAGFLLSAPQPQVLT